MGRTQRKNNSVVISCSLKFEIEFTTNAFSKGESPCFVHPVSKRRMDHQVHVASFIEETFHHNVILRGHDLQRSISGTEIINELFCCCRKNSFLFREPGKSILLPAVIII